MKKCSVIGCGRMFQLHHHQNLVKCKYEIDEIFDPRKKLLKKISVKLNIKKSFSNFTKFLENNSSKEFFFFLPRDISYYFLKRLLKKKNISVFIEKPPVLYKENFTRIIKLLKKNNNKLFIGYMFRYSHALKRLKSAVSKHQIKNIKKVYCEMSLNYDLKKNKYITFDEKISKTYIEKKINNKIKNIINYKVFLNRYSHVINLIYYLLKSFKVDKIVSTNFFNYTLFLKKNNTKIFINLNNDLNYRVKLDFYLHDKKEIKLNFNFNNRIFNTLYSEKNEQNVKKIKLKDDLYFNEINEFSSINKKKYMEQLSNFNDTLKFCEKI